MSESSEATETQAVEEESVDQALLDEMDDLDVDGVPEKPEDQSTEMGVEPEEKVEQEEEQKSAEEQRSEEGAEEKKDEVEGEVVEGDEEAEVEGEARDVEEERKREDSRLEAVLEQNRELQGLVKTLLEGRKEEQPEDTGEREVKVDKLDFFEGEDIGDDVYEPGKLKEYMNTMGNKVYNSAVEQAIRRVPALVEDLVGEVMVAKSARDKFYSDNPDLEQYGDDLRKIANFVANENPKMSLPEIFEETGRRFRLFKGMPKAMEDEKPPASPKSPSARKTKPKPPTPTKDEQKKSALYSEMDELDWE